MGEELTFISIANLHSDKFMVRHHLLTRKITEEINRNFTV